VWGRGWGWGEGGGCENRKRWLQSVGEADEEGMYKVCS